MKKLLILAVSAILVANVSAQEFKKEGCKDKQLSKEERIELDIKRLTQELMLSDDQAAKFAVTYREYREKTAELFKKGKPQEKVESGKELTDKELDKLAKKRFESMKDLAELQEKFYDKFRQDLSARQVEKVMRLNEPFGGKHCGQQCSKQDGQHHGQFGPQGQQVKPVKQKKHDKQAKADKQAKK